MREPAPARRIRTHELNKHGEPVARKRRSFLFRLIRALVVLGMISGMIGAGGLLWFLHQSERTPREWAPYLERRAMGHRGQMVAATGLVSQWLLHADRLQRDDEIVIPANVGASVARSGPTPPGRIRTVAGIADLTAAVAGAQPGDVITLLPGRYLQTGRNIVVSRGGTATAPIDFAHRKPMVGRPLMADPPIACCPAGTPRQLHSYSLSGLRKEAPR